MSQQGLHFSPHSKAKKAQISGKLITSGISDVVCGNQDNPTLAEVQDGPTLAEVQDSPTLAEFQDGPAPAEVQYSPALAEVQDNPAPVTMFHLKLIILGSSMRSKWF